MKTIAIYTRDFNPQYKVYIQNILNEINNLGGRVWIFENFFLQLEKNGVNVNNLIGTFKDTLDIKTAVDCFLSIGGDGTLLDTVAFVGMRGIPILGINIGKLGFLASVKVEDISNAMQLLFAGKYHVCERTLISVKSIENSSLPKINFALNDITITRKDSGAMIKIHAYVDEIFLNSYWADGIIIATPTGSTAYSLSCSGPILTPDSANILITPIAPHNLSVRPLVLPDTAKIKLIVESNSPMVNLTIDSRTYPLNNLSQIYIEKENFKIKLINIYGTSFFQIIRDKLMWGSDIRN